MTADELRERLQRMPEAEKQAFKAAVGLGTDSDEGVVWNFQAVPDYERRICTALKVPTQADSVAEATYAAVWYAKAAFITALALGIPGLAIAIYAALK